MPMLWLHLLAVAAVLGLGALLALVLLDVLRRTFDPPDELDLLLAGAGVALLGWASFGLWFAHPLLGQAFTWLLVAGTLGHVAWHRRRLRDLWHTRAGWRHPLLLIAAVALLYIGWLHLFAADLTVDQLAANRFLAGLPVDNEIPRLFAERLQRGESPRQLIGDWLSSDRPPLQTGLIVLFHPIADALHLPGDLAAHAVGLVFHLGWIAAFWALVRRLGASPLAATAMIAVTAFTATPLLHSLFVWPKLGAAAAVIGTFLLYTSRDPQVGPRLVLAAALAALGWLAHGSVAFSLLALALLAACRPSPPWRPLLLAVLTFAVLVAPWIAYQKLYEPPGDRLLKWHLAGVIPIDDRGAGETLRTAYGELPRDQLLAHKRANLVLPFKEASVPWRSLSPANAEPRRVPQFFYLFAAIGPWNCAWLGLVWLAWARWRRRRDPAPNPATTLALSPNLPALASAIAWAWLTLFVWAALMFGPATTLIHQGTLALPLVFTAVLMVLAWSVHSGVFAALALWQVVNAATTWLPASHAITGPLQPAALVTLLLGVAGLITSTLLSPHSTRLSGIALSPQNGRIATSP